VSPRTDPLPESIPVSLQEPLIQALRGLGDQHPIRAFNPLGGGCINNAGRLETSQGQYLLKWNAAPLPDMFPCEARGLELLAGVGAVRVPGVLAYDEASDNRPAYILLEWLESPNGSSDFSAYDQSQLGEQLAELHRQGISPQSPPAYGLDHDNYLGRSMQFNGWDTDWASFYLNCRLLPQQELAARNGYLTADRQRRLERLYQRLPDLFGSAPRQTSLIHGDLWGGNVIPSPQGLALIDPAVSYSDREAEIAYTEMFGGFSSRFYAGYQSVWPLDPGYRERRDLLNLYHLINHVNHFGESYGPQVDSILRRYSS
jgi:protein-ribulosamine 3-kinase